MRGLTSKEVFSRVNNGETNQTKSNTTKIFDIIKKHTFTLFNLVIFTLATLVFIFGQKRDIAFILVAFFSTLIAIINDIRAKFIIDKLNLISEQPATVIRDGKELKISPEKIVKDDIIKFSIGNQIIVDSKIVEGSIEVNESFITGESNNIKKSKNDHLLSGSFVVSGTCFAKVIAVGEENSISKTLESTKKIKYNRSQLFRTIDKIIKFGSIIIIPTGIILFFKQFFLESATISTATTSTVAALVAMIPEGLILLTSSILALASIRLAKKQVLIQDFYSIETLARIDTICLDKTGTLTTGNLKVEKIIPTKNSSTSEIVSIIQSINGVLGESNSTSTALLKKFGKTTPKDITETYPFSSDKKFSGFKQGSTKYLIGAYDFITKDQTFKATEAELAKNYRVLTVLKTTANSEKILGFILLSDEIRKNAKQLLDFFKDNQTKVKIISGDSLPTIKKILTTLNLPNQKAIDLSAQKNPNYQSLAKNFDIFARVKPEQKKLLISALKKSGHTVAMTGDGVNDCLALKEADCSISIGSASDAARRTANIVLLDNSFSSIPSVISEGYITINNITRSSALFLNKTIFATALSIIFIFLNFRYPFSPIEMSFINTIIIGIPSFMLALEPNSSRPTTRFKTHILTNSLPAALATIFSVIALVFLANRYNFSWQETVTFSCILTSLIGLLLIYKISRPLNKLRASLLAALLIISILVFLFPITREFFSLTLLSPDKILLLAILGLISSLIFCFFSRFLSRQSS